MISLLKTAKKENYLRTSDDNFTSGKGYLDYSEVTKNAIRNDANLSEREKEQYLRRYRKTSDRKDYRIEIIKDDEGTLQWRWIDNRHDKDAKKRVADTERKINDFGGESIAGRYDEFYDYMIRNNHIKFSSQTPSREEKENTDTETEKGNDIGSTDTDGNVNNNTKPENENNTNSTGTSFGSSSTYDNLENRDKLTQRSLIKENPLILLQKETRATF